jgi:hypothetical protein
MYSNSCLSFIKIQKLNHIKVIINEFNQAKTIIFLIKVIKLVLLKPRYRSHILVIGGIYFITIIWSNKE